jgi:hypothetical protein
MTPPCDVVAERLALGEPMAELAQHADDCPRCQGLLSVQRALTTSSRGDATPAHGFASRMTVAANQRLVVRHRRRVAGYAMLSAAVAAMVTFVIVREPDRASPPIAATTPERPDPANPEDPADVPDPWRDPNPAETPDEAPGPDEPVEELLEHDDDAYALYILAETAGARLSADWERIEDQPMRAYERLLEQVEN